MTNRKVLVLDDSGRPRELPAGDEITTSLPDGVKQLAADYPGLVPMVGQNIVTANDNGEFQEEVYGTAASKNIGTSGDTVPKNDTANTWTLAQTFSAGIVVPTSITMSGTAGSDRIDFTGNAGGGGTNAITYKDAAGSQRTAFFFPGSDVVAIANRAANGTVQIRANSATAGSGGESTVATFAVTGVTNTTAEINTSVITPAQLNANQADWAFTGHATARYIRASTGGGINLSGLQGGTSGRRVTLANVGSNNLGITHDDAASSAANRFFCPNSTSITLNPNDAVDAWYDSTSSRWRVVGL